MTLRERVLLRFAVGFAILWGAIYGRFVLAQGGSIGYVPPLSLDIRDEGSSVGRALAVDFTGSGVSCTFSATVATCAITGSGAPTDAEYIVGAANGSLSAERVVTNSRMGIWDLTTAAQAKVEFVPHPCVWQYVNTADVAAGFDRGLTSSAAGAGGVAVSKGTAKQPNTYRITTGTTDNGGIMIYWTTGASGGGFHADTFENADWILDFLVLPGANSTAITDAAWFAGFISDSTNPLNATACAEIRYDTDHSDATYKFLVGDSSTTGCQNAASGTNVDIVASTIAPSAGRWDRLKIERKASGVGGNPTLYFSVNDETSKTYCSSGCDATLGNYPTGTARIVHSSYYTRSTSSRTGELGVFHMKFDFGTCYGS